MQVNDISFWAPKGAYIKISGSDATEFLHRMSTNDVKGLINIGRGQRFSGSFLNCFVNNKGRLLDATYQKLNEDGSWLLQSAHEDPQVLIAWLEQYLFGEEVTLCPLPTFLEQTSPSPACGGESLDDRFEACLPAAPNEICDKYNPYEVGLAKAVAFNKGCYLGQEVLSRLDTYGKVSRQLVSLACREQDFSQLIQSPEITSSLSKYFKNKVIALGVFKKAALTAGGFVTTQNGTKAWVVSSAR